MTKQTRSEVPEEAAAFNLGQGALSRGRLSKECEYDQSGNGVH